MSGNFSDNRNSTRNPYNGNGFSQNNNRRTTGQRYGRGRRYQNDNQGGYNEQGNHYNEQGNRYNEQGNRYNEQGNRYNEQGNRYNEQGNRYNEQGNRGNNYSTRDNSSGQRYNRNDYITERGRRGGPTNVQAIEQRRRAAPYDPVSRSRQSSVRPQSRVRPPAREEQEMNMNQTENSYLAGWDSMPNSLELNQREREVNGSTSTENPSLLNTTYKLNPSKEKEKASTSASSSFETLDQPDDVEWVFSEQPSTSLVVGRPQSPPVWIDFDSLDKKDDDNKRIVKVKQKTPRQLFVENEKLKAENKNNNDYKGVSFPPPFPMAPVSLTTDFPTEHPKVSRIFENDSRSSAQSFEHLALISKKLWSKSTDVPLDLAKEQDVDPDKLMMVLREVGKENVTRPVPTEKPIPNTKPQDSKCNPDLKYHQSSSTIKISASSSSITASTSNHRTLSPRRRRGDDESYNANFATRSLRRENLISMKTTREKITKMDLKNNKKVITEKTSVVHNEYNMEEQQFIQSAQSSEHNREQPFIQSTQFSECRQQFIQSTQSRKRYEKTPEAEEVCDMVKDIYHTNNARWLSCTLAAAHKLIPQIMLFDTLTIQMLLKILSSNPVLDTNNKDTKLLISMFVDQPSFFKKIFSYMKEEINIGSDLVPVIRLSDFIVKISPDAVERIPCEDIYEVCNRVEGTFSEAESNEVRAKLEDIKEYQSRVLKNASERKKIEYQQKIANKMEAPFQMKAPIQPSNPPNPDWIASHRFKYKKKPLMPSPEEIFNLKSIMTEPTLTPHLVNLSWLPEYEDIYRQIHYDLLRTEVVEDLQRASVAFFAAICKDYKPLDNSLFYNYVYYHDVQIDETYIDKDYTPCVRIGFKSSRPVDWIKGEHLIYGTFVLLLKVKNGCNNVSVDTSDVICAMVEYFNLDDVIRPNGESFVGLNFTDSEFDKLDLKGKYVMLESTRNYASIRPVMEWLNESSKGIQRNSPLYQELFACCSDSNPVPGYLENVEFDITSILIDQRKPIITKDRMEWPRYLNSYGKPAYNMELSCVIALRQIISRKVAVIVAPVVTSKAKVASTAVEFLNRALKRSQCFEPILILTRSSYALDSILEKLLPSFPDLIRCGSLSKCNNPALKARQIQDVVNEYLNLRKSNLWKDWSRIRRESNSKQEELAALWSFRKYALSTLYFIKTCPQAFRNQLIPTDLKTRGYSEKLLVHCLELWLSGVSKSHVANSLKTNAKISEFRDSSSRLNLPAFVANQDSNPCSPQGIVELNLAVNNPNFLFTNEMINKGTRSHYDSQVVSPSLFTELSESYLFENDRTKSNRLYDDDISTSSILNKEILDHQIDDRVIYKSEEGQANPREHNFSKYRAEFSNATNEFWRTSGPDIWIMTLDERKTLYNNFLNHHINYCDQRIINLQKDAILEEEKVKSTRIARWTEVCNFAPVIGMTMNYAIANREVLNTLKPRVCIVDEASEISEAQLMFLIASNRLEHLIMFGDTQYSKPDVKSKTAQKYGLNISLFERWTECDGGDHVSLKQQSRMHPAVHDLVRVLYNEKLEEYEEYEVAKNIPEIMGVPSHVFFMTHDNFDENSKFFSTNTFEAKFIINFAFYLYQQGYDPSRITILTPYFAQKRLILKLMKPELKKEPRDDNRFGRFDKDRNQTGKIKVELIDNYYSDENDIVLLSLVAVNENWHEEALKILNDKKRAIIALSRALSALYIFGNQKMLSKSEIWAPVVRKLAASPNTYGKSLILSCNTHIKPRIEITTVEDFEIKVPFGGCSEPCRGLLKCGHACQRKCHPIPHTKEVNYICLRPCGGQGRPEGCEHSCPKYCYECEQAGKCPPCDLFVRTKLRCGHTKSIPCRQTLNTVCEEDVSLKLRCGHSIYVKCFQKDNEEFIMTMECKVMRRFNFPNCNHSIRLPCSTRSPVCKETCGKLFPCGHHCQRQCGPEHFHERSDCLSECSKMLICGHQCANGCSEPDRHTSFCTKQCRIKCLHGSICPKSCFETCTRCLEPCPWKCSHYQCRKKCHEPCNRPPCDIRCIKKLECGHRCYGFCGEECPPCLLCKPDTQCKITLQTFSEMNRSERLYMLPECKCVFTAEGLDLFFENQVKNGEHTAVRLWQCPSCQEPIFTAMRYNRYLKTEIKLWNIIKHKQEMARNSISSEERKQIIKAMNEETRSTDLNSMVGGRWFVCPNNHPYYIGNCGGATQVSKCPECSETIGGMQHKVVSTNRFYGEFDNSTSPAWPGQH